MRHFLADFTGFLLAVLCAVPSSAAMVYGEDDRQQQTYQDIYGWKDVGIIMAGRHVGVGTLVLRGDVIVTSAHVIYDNTGMLRASEIVFFPDGDPKKEVKVDTDRMVAGNQFVQPGLLEDDWILLRLMRDVLADNPNQGFSSRQILPVNDLNFDEIKNEIVHVSFDFRRRPFRKLINRGCRLHTKKPGDMFWGTGSILLHNCDLARPDNSGSPIFYSGGDVSYLIGIHQGGHKDFYGAEFDPRINPNFAFGLDNKFENALGAFIKDMENYTSTDQ